MEVDPRFQICWKSQRKRRILRYAREQSISTCRIVSTRRTRNTRLFRKWIYANKMRFSKIVGSGRNREEGYMLKKHNMTRYIKFLGDWIKTTISFFTFTITKIDTKSRTRG